MWEVTSHWISSYFLEDKFLRLPQSPEAALEDAERAGAYMRKRVPTSMGWINESYSAWMPFLKLVLFSARCPPD